MITEGNAAIPLETTCTPSVIKRKQNKDQLNTGIRKLTKVRCIQGLQLQSAKNKSTIQK